MASATKDDIHFNVVSFCGVKGCLLFVVVGHSFLVRLLSPNVFVPQNATANSFTNKASLVLAFDTGPGLLTDCNFSSQENLTNNQNKTDLIVKKLEVIVGVLHVYLNKLEYN